MSAIIKKDLLVNYDEVIEYIAKQKSQNIDWIGRIAEYTGYNVIKINDKMPKTEIDVSDLIAMPGFQIPEMPELLKALSIKVTCSNKFYDITTETSERLQKIGVQINIRPTDTYFREITNKYEWDYIKSTLNNNLNSYNTWACTKVLIYSKNVPDEFKFKHIIKNREDYESMANYIINRGEFDDFVKASDWNLESIKEPINKMILDKARKMNEIIKQVKELIH